MSEALLNCPFCDSFCVDIVSGRHVYYWQQCKNCKCEGPVAETVEECIKKWNTRNTVIQARKERDEWMERALASEALAERHAPPTCGECGTEITSKVYCHECSGLLDCSIFCVTCGDHGCPDCRPGEVWS